MLEIKSCLAFSNFNKILNRVQNAFFTLEIGKSEFGSGCTVQVSRADHQLEEPLLERRGIAHGHFICDGL